MEDQLRTDRPTRLARPRPTRAEMETAALDLIRRHGAAILATARRYSATPEDADDAYQRGLEILLTKAPTVEEDDLLPWLKTVVKHEAFAMRRSRERGGLPADDGVEEPGAASSVPTPAEQAERYERLRLGAEAIRRLKPQETRCLLLRAEGYSYRQICEATGWTYTKVNRCLTEGRRSFVDQIEGIEAGTECRRLEPLLSAMADGEATSQQMLTLRPHLRSCLMCRATLRRYRSVPSRISAVAAPLAIASSEPDVPGALTRGYESITIWLQDRSLLLGMKAQQAVEIASAGKIAAIAASTVALGGGGIAVVSSLEAKPSEPRKARQEAHRTPAPPRAARSAPAPVDRRARPDERRGHAGAPKPSPEPAAVPGPSPSPSPSVALEPERAPEETTAREPGAGAVRTQQPAAREGSPEAPAEQADGERAAPPSRASSAENGGYGL